MIFESQIAPAPVSQSSSSSLSRSRLQRKCACGGTPGPSGECAACEKKRHAGTPLQPKLAINAPGDKYEREADRMADSVMSGKEENVERRTSNVERRIQREEKTPPPKDNYEEAKKKALDALQETPIAKQLKAKAEEMGAEFLSSVEGKVIAGTALGGALAGIIASNSEFPVGIPELPLDFIAPGLKAKITWEGPSQNPTAAGLTLTSGSGVSVGGSYTSTPASPGKPAEQKAGLSLTIPLGGSSKKKGPSDKEKFRAETARLAGQQNKIREGQKSSRERAADKAFLDDYVRSKLNDPSNPLALPGLGRPLVPEPERKWEEEEPLQRKASSESASVGNAPPIVDQVLQSPGQKLDSGTRRFMEERFGHDFSNVRVHRNSQADASARAVSALAFTVGQDIVFRGDAFAPDSLSGRRLLAHELAHVVQQGATPRALQRATGTAVTDQILAAPSKAAGGVSPQIERLAGQPSARAGSAASAGIAPVLASPGTPLPPPLRKEMEQRFGHDFSQVRLHADGAAAASARALGARAFTYGSHIVFETHQFAPHTGAGRRLLAHELTHVLQQRGAEPLVQREMYYGGGYKQRAYGSVDEEIASGKKKPSEWHPATRDMAATATGSGGGEAVSTLDDLLTKLEAKGKGSVTRLNLIGHSNSYVFSFGGKITKDNVQFSPDAALYADALRDNAKRITALRDRFAEGAKIVLYSCDAGTGPALLEAVGDAFGVCVEGFTSEIWWCLSKAKDGTAVRGRVWAQNPKDPLPSDPPNCDNFASDVTTLTTGGKSKQCGAKKP